MSPTAAAESSDCGCGVGYAANSGLSAQRGLAFDPVKVKGLAIGRAQ